MSWFPGTTTSGRSSERRRRAARSCWSGVFRCARSPVARTTSGSARRTSSTRSASTSGSSCVPAWRSETCSNRRFGIGRADYSESMVDEPAEIFDDMYLGLRAGAAERKKRRGEPLSAGGAGGPRPLAAALGVAQDARGWRVRGRDVRARVHARRPDLRPLAPRVAGTGVGPPKCAACRRSSPAEEARLDARPHGIALVQPLLRPLALVGAGAVLIVVGQEFWIAGIVGAGAARPRCAARLPRRPALGPDAAPPHVEEADGRLRRRPAPLRVGGARVRPGARVRAGHPRPPLRLRHPGRRATSRCPYVPDARRVRKLVS